MSQKNDTPVLILSLLITIALLGGGFWWFSRRAGFNLGQVFQPNNSSNSQPSAANSSPGTLGQSEGQTFGQVQSVPTGLFSYGGSTSWAPIRLSVDAIVQAERPEFRLRYVAPVTGIPGSGTGIQMLINDQIAFAQSSRPVLDKEYQQAQTRGFSLKQTAVAIEGIAIAVHPNLSVEGITLAQLKDIYTGKLTNWSQLGGPNLKITPYSRRADGGTVEFFVENVLGGERLSPTVEFVNDTTQALRRVSADPGSIYYASAPEVVPQCTVKPLPVGRQQNEFVPPYQTPFVPLSQCPSQRNQINIESFQSGQYPLTRNLYVVSKQNGQVEQQAGEAYANLLLSNQGQELIARAGFVRLR
jgi:phosphate transport system substrate-binding protein